MLTMQNSYSTALASPFEENWVVRLYSDSSNYIGISFSTITMNDSIAYTGAILNRPTIRDAINPTSGETSSSNIKLEVADFDISSNALSKTLYTGNYINKNVKIYSVLNSDTNFTNALQIFEGRLNSIELSETNKIILDIVTHRPWDGIKFPNERTNNDVYVPIVYGNYTGNTLRATTGHELAPLPFVTSNSIYLWYANSGSTQNNNTHFYDSGSKNFPSLTFGHSNSRTIEGKDCVSILDSVTRSYRIRPVIDITSPSNEFTNPDRAVDTDNTNFAQSQLSALDSTEEHEITLSLPTLSGKITACAMYVKWDLSYGDGEQSQEQLVRLSVDSLYGSTVTSTNLHNDTTVVVNSTETHSSSGYADITNTGTAYSYVNLTTLVSNNNDQLPDSIDLTHKVTQGQIDNPYASLDSTCKIYDVWFHITTANDTANEPLASSQEKDLLDTVYANHDGYTKSWGSGVATKPHDIYRDLLHRFLGVTTAPSNYSDLNNEKNGTMRFFTEPNKPEKALDLLNKISYEGGFNFRFRANGEPVFHFIPNSPSTDISLVHNDITGLQIGHVGLSELVTDWTVRFDKNPASSQRFQSATHVDSNRSNYNFTTDENKRDINLEYLDSAVAKTNGNRNDSFLNYYADMLSSLKQIISFNLVNPAKSNIECGDIIDFSSMSVDSLNGNWNSKYFVISTTRSVGGTIQVRAREI